MDKKKKGRFSKAIVLSVIVANVIFTVVVLALFRKTSNEPSALIASWFAFTTVEVWSLAKIKTTKESRGNSNGELY